MNVEVTPLPGIGVRKDFALRGGRRIGVVTHRDGKIELIISKSDDPDACLAELPLSADEAGALANLLVRSDKLEQTLRWTGQIGRWLETTRNEGVRVLGPSVAPIMRLKRDYRYHFILKAEGREKLNATLRKLLGFAAEQKIPRTNLIVDVDALSLL